MMRLDSREAIITMVDLFYQKVKTDELLGPVFAHVDWPAHLPIMHNFWSSMILGDLSYQGNPFAKHIHLKITEKHFSQWLQLFDETIIQNFEGEHAQEARRRAAQIASVWSYKLSTQNPA